MIKIIGIIFLINSVLLAGVDNKGTIKEVLKETEVRAKVLITKHLQKFSDYIDSIKKNTKVFADELMSLKSMWLYLKSKLPFTKKKIYSEHIMSLFKKHFLSLEDLTNRIKMNIKYFLKDLEALENVLAVNLQKVLVNKNTGGRLDLKSITQELNVAIKDTLSISEHVSFKEINKLIVLEVATIIGVIGLSKLIVSSGIVTAGVLNSWATLGASIVVGVAAERVWNKFDNPQERIKKKLVNVLENIKNNCMKYLRIFMSSIVKHKIHSYKQILNTQEQK